MYTTHTRYSVYYNAYVRIYYTNELGTELSKPQYLLLMYKRTTKLIIILFKHMHFSLLYVVKQQNL